MIVELLRCIAVYTFIQERIYFKQYIAFAGDGLTDQDKVRGSKKPLGPNLSVIVI